MEPKKIALGKWNGIRYPRDDCKEAVNLYRNGKNGVSITALTMESKRRTSVNGSTYNVTTKATKDRQARIKEEKIASKKEKGRNAHIFHPNRLRPCAPIPSLSRPRVSSHMEAKYRRPFSISRRSPSSYAKQIRSMESPPRQQLSKPGRKLDTTGQSVRNRSNLRNPSATLQSEMPRGVDRIEQSRNLFSATNLESKVLLDLEGNCELDPPTESSNCAPKGFLKPNQLDRIECTRENGDETGQSKISSFRERIGDQRPSWNQMKIFKRTSFLINEEIDSMPDPDQIQIESQDMNRNKTSFTVHSRNIGPVTRPFEDQKPRPSSQYENFHSLRLKYTEHIQNVVAKTDTAYLSMVDTEYNSFEPMIVIRSRPLLEHEIQKGGYSIIDIPLKSTRTMAMYETNMLPCKKALNVKAHVFQFDAVSSERDSFDNFYSRVVRPSVNNAMKGGLGAILVYGSDEFGKSNIVSGIEKRLSNDLFSSLSLSSSTPSVFVTHLGFGSGRSDLCIDLMSPYHHFVEVIESNGTYSAEGATEIGVCSSSQLLDALSNVKQNLASERILRRESESSSYSLCRIAIQSSGSNEQRGLFYLVQCPSGDEVCSGCEPTERNKNCGANNPLARMMEVIQANKKTRFSQKGPVSNNLMSCNLTKLLGQSITSTRKQPSSVCLVGAVSPASEDTGATLSTLLSSREYMNRRTCSDAVLKGAESATVETKDALASEAKGEKKDMAVNECLLLPRQWSQKQLWAWMKRKRLVHENTLEGEITGKTIMNMTKDQLNDLFYRSERKNENGACKLFDALRAENDRISRLRVKRKFARNKANN